MKVNFWYRVAVGASFDKRQFSKGTIMKKIILASALALACSAGTAQAAVTINFAGGSGALTPGTTVLENFDALAAGASIGMNAFALASTGAEAARPAFGSTDNYGAVLTGGSYSINFWNTDLFAFVIGSLDFYNTLTLRFADGSSQTLTGGDIVGDPSLNMPGNRTDAETNGVVSYRVTSGSLLTGATFTSTYNAFEIDNVAVAVPEPAAWAMMIFGFALVGGSLRRRPSVKVNFA
jgi:hypothetical protein